jgi:DNA-directed RNA polymerase specialized sigma24 family protein
MNRSVPPLSPLPEDGRSLHQRLCEGDKVAVSEFAAAYLQPLGSWLESHNRDADPHLCWEAAGEAILTLLKDPSRFDPKRSELFAFLCMSARGDFLNALRREKRQCRGQERLSDVELSPDGGKYLGRVDDPSLRLRIAEGSDGVLSPADAAVRAELGGPERVAFDLMIQGVRKHGEFAQALGLTDRPDEVQRREVKRFKDKMTKRRKRAGGGHEESP